jgi:hypothetical protein
MLCAACHLVYNLYPCLVVGGWWDSSRFAFFYESRDLIVPQIPGDSFIGLDSIRFDSVFLRQLNKVVYVDYQCTVVYTRYARRTIVPRSILLANSIAFLLFELLSFRSAYLVNNLEIVEKGRGGTNRNMGFRISRERARR